MMKFEISSVSGNALACTCAKGCGLLAFQIDSGALRASVSLDSATLSYTQADGVTPLDWAAGTAHTAVVLFHATSITALTPDRTANVNLFHIPDILPAQPRPYFGMVAGSPAAPLAMYHQSPLDASPATTAFFVSVSGSAVSPVPTCGWKELPCAKLSEVVDAVPSTTGAATLLDPPDADHPYVTEKLTLAVQKPITIQ